MGLDISTKLTHSYFEEQSIGSTQFNREIINIMLPT